MSADMMAIIVLHPRRHIISSIIQRATSAAIPMLIDEIIVSPRGGV